ncbi:MAG: NDP-sugar synthase [Polaromonas sp.]|jgi:mannose-1-phosphate guanylyltransferase
MITKAIILAAGRGTRLQPLTADTPKPMIPLLGKPVMEYVVEHLVRQGIKEIMVNTSHFAQRIEQYFGDGRRFGVHIGYSFEGHVKDGQIAPEPMGSAGALRNIHKLGGFIDETTAVLCGDAVVDIKLQAAAAIHLAQGAIASAITREVADHEVANHSLTVTQADGRLLSFQDKPAPHQALSRQANTGIYLIEPEVLGHIPAQGVYDIANDLFPSLLRQGLPSYAQSHDFEWLDIGRLSDYWQIVQRMMQGQVAGVTLPGQQMLPGVSVGLNTRVAWDSVQLEGPIFIGSGSRIDAGCVLRGPVWIGSGCHVEAGTVVERSVLFDYARIGAGATVREALVSGAFCVSRDGHVAQAANLPVSQRWWGDARQSQPLSFLNPSGINPGWRH